MKIAAVTNDGESISQHFGRSRYYKILSVEDGEIKNSEIRERGTGHFAQQQQRESHTDHFDAQGRHGFGPDANNRHMMMAQEISDCDVLIAGGMGAGAYQSKWNGKNNLGWAVASGVYIARLTTGNYIHSIKMNLIK